MEDPHLSLIRIARMFIGTVETGPNKGPMIEEFQRAVDGRANGEPYCMAFVQWCLKQVDAGLREDLKSWPNHILFVSESCMNTWNMSPAITKCHKPEPGFIAVWRHWSVNTDKQGRKVEVPLGTGHAGIVVRQVDASSFETVEANTSAPKGLDKNVVREGDGIWLKQRPLTSDNRLMRLMGFLDPWAS